MKFELRKSVFVDGIPSLVIPVSELLKGKDYAKSETAYEEIKVLNKCIQMFTSFCGRECYIPRQELLALYSQIEKTGVVVFDCIQAGDNPRFLIRVLSSESERELILRLMPTVVKGRLCGE